MATSKLDPTQASQLFTQQAKVHESTAQTVASLLQASLTDPSLASIADKLARQVYQAAEATLAELEGLPLEPSALQAGEKASRSIQQALESMVEVRSAYWRAYRQTEVPKDAAWLPESSDTLPEIAAQLASMAKSKPAAATVNSEQVMLALPGEDAKAVLARHAAAIEVPEAGGSLGTMDYALRSRITKAHGLAAVEAAVAKDPQGRDLTTLLGALEVMARDSYGSNAPKGAYFTLGVRSLVHPEEINRLVAHAAQDLKDNHGTSLTTFVGNLRYALGYGMHAAGTEPHWRAALEALK